MGLGFGELIILLIIVLLDQLVWRPLLAWAERFKVSQVESDNPTTSWFLNSLRRSALAGWIVEKVFSPLYRRLNERLNKPPKEVAGVAGIVRSLGLRTARIQEPGTLDGGDVLQAGHTVYVGRGGRTNGAGIRQLRALLAPLGRTVTGVPLGEVLHLKSAVTALPDGTFLLLPDLVPAGLFPAVRPVTEESGCHVVPLGGDRVLIAASAPRTAASLEDLGFTPVVVDISEFEKLEGCVTCLSVLLPGR